MLCLKCNTELETKTAHYGLHPVCFTAWFKCPTINEFASLTRRSSSSTSNAKDNLSPQNNSFFQGKFKKYSAELAGQSYILKMREVEAPELPEVEYVCNQIGKLLEIPAAEFYLIHFNDELVFVTKNFIRPGAPTDLQHIYHYRDDDKHSCEGLIHVIATQTKRPYDVSQFIKTTLFDALIGNHDRHGKNLALVVSSDGTALSPIYDNVSYLSLEKGNMLKADFNPTGRIHTRSTFEPSMRDYVKEFSHLGYQNEIIEFHKKIKINDLHKLITQSHCSELMKAALTRLISKRLQELEDEIQFHTR